MCLGFIGSAVSPKIEHSITNFTNPKPPSKLLWIIPIIGWIIYAIQYGSYEKSLQNRVQSPPQMNPTTSSTGSIGNSSFSASTNLPNTSLHAPTPSSQRIASRGKRKKTASATGASSKERRAKSNPAPRLHSSSSPTMNPDPLQRRAIPRLPTLEEITSSIVREEQQSMKDLFLSKTTEYAHMYLELINAFPITLDEDPLKHKIHQEITGLKQLLKEHQLTVDSGIILLLENTMKGVECLMNLKASTWRLPLTSPGHPRSDRDTGKQEERQNMTETFLTELKTYALIFHELLISPPISKKKDPVEKIKPKILRANSELKRLIHQHRNSVDAQLLSELETKIADVEYLLNHPELGTGKQQR